MEVHVQPHTTLITMAEASSGAYAMQSVPHLHVGMRNIVHRELNLCMQTMTFPFDYREEIGDHTSLVPRLPPPTVPQVNWLSQRESGLLNHMTGSDCRWMVDGSSLGMGRIISKVLHCPHESASSSTIRDLS